MYFDRFDICEAYYLIYCEWGEYSWSNKFHNIGFRASANLSYESLTDNAKEIYDTLETKMIEKYYTSKGIEYKND